MALKFLLVFLMTQEAVELVQLEQELIHLPEEILAQGLLLEWKQGKSLTYQQRSQH